MENAPLQWYFLKMMVGIFLGLFLFGQNVLAEIENSLAESRNFTDRISSTLTEIGGLDERNFPLKISSLRERVERFLNYQKKICQGEFSTIVLNEFGQEEGEGQNELKKLDENERKLCFRELKNIQIMFINATHKARRNYLTSIHQKEMEGLDTLRKESIQSVQKVFSNI